MKIAIRGTRKVKYAFMALGLAAAIILPSVAPSQASAAQVTSRYIKMSNSTGGAGGVSYEMSFKVATAATLKGVVVDFCSESPIIGAACTKPSGFVAGTTGVTNSGLTGTWTASATNSNRTFVYSSSTANTNVAAGSTITITAGGFTNPTANNTTFYARILTYTSDTNATGYTLAATNSTDTGGVALSTGNAVSVSGTVAESLTFCVSGSAIGASCSNLTDPTIELGEGDPKALSTGARSTSQAFSQLSTNAGSGATIRMKNSNACGGLSKDNGTTCEIGPSTSASPINAGTAKFGVNVSSAGLTVPAIYGTASNYGMEWVSGGASGVTSLYGSTVASSTGVVNAENTTYTFAASIDNTIPAGVYTATMTLIATGTY